MKKANAIVEVDDEDNNTGVSDAEMIDYSTSKIKNGKYADGEEETVEEIIEENFSDTEDGMEIVEDGEHEHEQEQQEQVVVEEIVEVDEELHFISETNDFNGDGELYVNCKRNLPANEPTSFSDDQITIGSMKGKLNIHSLLTENQKLYNEEAEATTKFAMRSNYFASAKYKDIS